MPKKLARTLEQQIADRYIVQRKRYRVFKSEGGEVGKVNGLAIIGDRSGIIMPIAAEAAPAQSKDEGKIIATGKLGEIAKEAVQNVSALVKKTHRDRYLQLRYTHPVPPVLRRSGRRQCQCICSHRSGVCPGKHTS
nr:S16 family serine protease [Methanobacterium formicicum]